MNGGQPPTQSSISLEEIGANVRNWVHYDTAIANLNKEINKLREFKRSYETTILSMLQKSDLKHPVIQINGGRIVVGDDKTQQPLSLRMLEGMLDTYYASKPGSRPETKEILKFIRDHRGVEVKSCLKRVNNQKSRDKDRQA